MAKKTIKAQMKQRRDTKANWAATNPVLLDGELGIVSDDPNLYKVGDGATAWNDLPFRGFDGTLAQELGTSPNAVISQKIVSEKLTELESETNNIVSATIGKIHFNINSISSDADADIDTRKVSNVFVLVVESLDGNGLRIQLNYKDGTIATFAPTLGETVYNGGLNVDSYRLYHRHGTGSLVTNINIRFVGSLAEKIEEVSKMIPMLMPKDEGVAKSDIVDNLLESEKGKVLDARQGKALSEMVNISVSDEFRRFSDYELIQGWCRPENGSFYDGEGAGARHRTNKIPVQPGEKYLISGVISSTMTCLAFLFGGENEGAILPGTGTPISYVDYEVIIPNGCTDMVVQSNDPTTNLIIKKAYKVFKAYTKAEADAMFGTSGNAGLLYKGSEVIHLEDNIAIENFELAEGWNGNAEDGYTHTTSTNPIILNIPTEKDASYLFEADVEIESLAVEFCKVSIGNLPPCLTYNGTRHISVPILSDGGNLMLTPAQSNLIFSIKNIQLRKISDNGVEKLLELYNIISSNHTQNYGFWNVLLGASTAQNAVGTTRTICIGNFALSSLKSGNRNIAVGTYAMNEMTRGENNIAIGADSMEYVKDADDCVSIGKGAMNTGQSHSHNIAIGGAALANSAESQHNVAIGYSAGYGANGSNNICIGNTTGNSIGNGQTNICIGRFADASGLRNTCVGDRTSAVGVNDSIALGTTAKATKSNQMVLGGAGITEVIMCGNKKIIFNADGSVTWETIS